MWKTVCLALGIAVAASGTSLAEDLPGDPTLGRQLADGVCSACHKVEKGMDESGRDGAPSFQTIADNPTMTPLAIRFILQSTQKQNMPNLILTADETDDIIAYIRGLDDEG